MKFEIGTHRADMLRSLSLRRAWIEIRIGYAIVIYWGVALLTESVD